MLNEESQSSSGLNNLHYPLNSVAIEFDPDFNLMADQFINGNNELMQPIMDMIDPEEETLTMEEYKYLQEPDYPPIYQEPSPGFPPSDPSELCNTDYPGRLNFEVYVDPNVLKNPWVYSPLLNKMYIDMKHKFPINFSVRSGMAETQLFVRTMPMFEEDRYVQELVHRCICHEQLQDPTNHEVTELVAQHIMRCDNDSARYFGDKNIGKRLSIVFPLGTPQAGMDSIKEFFYFVCKNSCVGGGMNRRPIQVIFTLEDVSGNVLGRRVLCVRICSCPKRDRDKEELKLEKTASHSKKRKLDKKVAIVQAPEPTDTRLFPLTIDIAGEANYKHVLKTIQSLMAEEIVKTEAANGVSTTFKKCRNDAIDLMGHVSD